MEKLEIGQTFEVVEILKDGDYEDNLLKIGGHTIKIGNRVITNGDCSLPNRKEYLNQSAAYMYDEEIKPIGRLKIKSLK